MNRLALPGLLVLILALAAVVAGEALYGGGPAPVVAQAPAASPTAQSPAADPAPAQVAALLARPPFSPNRKPDPHAAASTDDASLPHLTGITVTRDASRAIFAGAAGARSAVVAAGDHVGAYSVDRITPTDVTLTGPDGTHTVRPTFSTAPPPAAPGALPPGGLLAGLPIAGLPPPPMPQPAAMPPFPAPLPPAAPGLGRTQ